MSRGSTPGPEPDDFVRKVVPDPANPPNAVVLEGFVGDSDAEGYVRVYGDPSLATWVDVPADAILHSVRVPEDRSPVGGSILWIDGGATLRPPPAAPPKATAADFLRGPVQADLGAAARAGGAGQPAITLWTWNGCPPYTIGIACTVTCPRPTTAATLCTYSCPSVGITCTYFCPRPRTITSIYSGCAAAPDTSTCAPPEGVAAQQRLIGPTGWFGCTRLPQCVGPTGWHGCLTHQYGCPRTSTCPPTHTLGCPDTSTCPPTQMLGCPDTSTCPPTQMLGCPRTSTCPPTHMPGCPDTSTCPPGAISEICVTQVGCFITWICGPGGA
ncbi:MAG TPA: hypothetical protein VGW75_16690 [Solirubrobacteraceae bacterium]|nr:hypothetical protein [Solirubrobacteraceae bacterium]